LAQSVQDNLVCLHEEVDLGQKTVSFKELVDITVGEEDQLFWGCVTRLEQSLFNVFLLSFGIVGEQKRNFLDTLFFLDLGDDLVVFLHEVFEDRLEQGHGLVLEQVSEVLQVLSQGLSVVVLDANVDQGNHKTLHHRIVSLVPSVLKCGVQRRQSLLPVAVGAELFSLLQGTFGSHKVGVVV